MKAPSSLNSKSPVVSWSSRPIACTPGPALVAGGLVQGEVGLLVEDPVAALHAEAQAGRFEIGVRVRAEVALHGHEALFHQARAHAARAEALAEEDLV